MFQAKSAIKINTAKINQLTRATIVALEQTAEALHTEVIQAQVMPFDDPRVEEYKEYGKRGQFAKNGREYKGVTKTKKIQIGGTLQNESTFVDTANAVVGSVDLVSNTPYARRLYYHPEYNFDTGENPHARGEWYEDWLPGGKRQAFCQKAYTELYKKAGGL